MKKYVLLFLLMAMAAMAFSVRAQEPDSSRRKTKILPVPSGTPKNTKAVDGLQADTLTIERVQEILVKRQLDYMSSTVDQVWLNKTYSETNEEELRLELNLYEPFINQDAKANDAYQKLNSFFGEVHLYNIGVKTLEEPYDAQKVSDAKSLLSGLVVDEKQSARKDEVEKTLNQLNNYKYVLIAIQEIIGEIDEKLEGYQADGTSGKAWEQIEKYLETNTEGLEEDYLVFMPWLGEQYHKYVNQLKTGAYADNEARDTIMKLEP